MDTILLSVTGVSLALAAVMGVLLARMLRDERRRSDARVALLSELAADPAGPTMRNDFETADHRAIAVPRVSDMERPQRRLVPAPERPVVQSKSELQPTVRSQPVVRRVAPEPHVEAEPPIPPSVQPPTQARPAVQPRALEQPVHAKSSRFFAARSGAGRRGPASEELGGVQGSPPLRIDEPDDFELRPAAHEVQGVQDLFHEPERPSAWPRRLAAVGGLAAVVAFVVFGWSNLRFQGPQATTPAAAIPEVAVDAPLELLSLRHAQQDGTLTITGVVQNPRAGRELSGVKATLFVFGPGGSFMTSGRAPLDFVSLGPGHESPFVIRVPVTGEVARYRIGFRGDDDRVLAHVDRRSADAIAQK